MTYTELFGLASQIYTNLPCKSESCTQCQHQKVCELAAGLWHELFELFKEEEMDDNDKNSNNH